MTRGFTLWRILMKETKELRELTENLINDVTAFHETGASMSLKTLFEALNAEASGEELPTGFMIHAHAGLQNKVTDATYGITMTLIVEVDGNDVIETPPINNMRGHGPIFENKAFAPVMTKLRDFPQVMETEKRS